MKYNCKLHQNDFYSRVLSPCRGKCRLCEKKKVHGYSNPDNIITTSFGYMYLIPMICIDCSEKKQRCMWCVK